MPYSIANDPNHWRTRAEEARRVAENLTDAQARKHMTACAEAYERLAVLAEQRALYDKQSRPA